MRDLYHSCSYCLERTVRRKRWSEWVIVHWYRTIDPDSWWEELRLLPRQRVNLHRGLRAVDVGTLNRPAVPARMLRMHGGGSNCPLHWSVSVCAPVIDRAAVFRFRIQEQACTTDDHCVQEVCMHWGRRRLDVDRKCVVSVQDVSRQVLGSEENVHGERRLPCELRTEVDLWLAC